MKRITRALVAAPFVASSIASWAASPPFDLRTVAEKVGYLSFNDGSGKSFCNISIVGESLGLTNAHCMPNVTACETGMAYFFDQSGAVSSSYQCKKLLFTGADAQGKVETPTDFALIAFEGTPGLDIGFLKLVDNSKLSTTQSTDVWRIKINPPSAGGLEARLDYANCQAVIKGSAGLEYLEMLGMNADESCQVFRGNSGGPVLNAKGELIGLTAKIQVSGTSIPALNDFAVKTSEGPVAEVIHKKYSEILKSR